MKKHLVLVVVLVLVGAAAWAQGAPGMRTGQWLHSLWESLQKIATATSSDEVMTLKQQLILYDGYVEGASAVMWAAGWLNLSNSTSTWAQEAIIVGKYLDDHPEQWSDDAEVLIYRALHAIWPGAKAAPAPYYQ
jgi:hypothetical protein